MIDVEFYCDEAGRLGYVDQPENTRGEFTLVAGLIVEKHNKRAVGEFCDYLENRFGDSQSNSKFHITDMAENRPIIRKEVIKFITSYQIPLVYGANYFQALHSEYIKQKKINVEAVATMKKQGIGLSKNIVMFKKNAQAEAFFSFYCKAMGSSLQVFQQPISGLVKTDRIDNKIQDEYTRAISKYHTLSSGRPLKGRHYDYQTGEVRTFGVSVDVQVDDPNYKLMSDSLGKIEIIDTHISILADVVANSLNHHLEKYVSNSNCGPLNSLQAIEGYELAGNIIVIGENSMDLRYPYPVA